MIEFLQTYAIPFAQNPSYPAGTTPQVGSLYPLLIFVAIIVALRLYRGINGRIYSTARVLRIPVIYVVLTVVTLLSLSLFDMYTLLTLLFIPVGALLGYRFGTNVKFMVRNNALYYVRSPAIMIIWLASFLARFLLEYLYPGNVNVMLIVDSALTLTTGIFIGEALNVVRKRKEYGEPKFNSGSEPEEFKINM